MKGTTEAKQGGRATRSLGAAEDELAARTPDRVKGLDMDTSIASKVYAWKMKKLQELAASGYEDAEKLLRKTYRAELLRVTGV